MSSSQQSKDKGQELSVSRLSGNANLASMPDEIVLSITKYMDSHGLKNLALTCTNLRRIVSTEFYLSNNYETFRLALRSADLAMLERCVLHDAAPVDAIWKSPFPEDVDFKGCECNCEISHRVHQPMHYLMLGLEKDESTADGCFEMLRWLIDNGADITTASLEYQELFKEDWDAQMEFARTMRHMPPSFLSTFKTSADRAKLDGAAKIICYLSSQGFSFPREIQGIGSILRSREEYAEFAPLNYDSEFLLTLLMRSACPPSVLEAFLAQLQRQGVTLASPREECPAEFRYFQYPDDDDEEFPDDDDDDESHPVILTHVWELVGELYNDLLDPQRWKPAHNGEIGDIWGAKISLLVKYEGVDDVERRLLTSILAALRRIETMANTSGGLEIKRDAKTCWWHLSMALASFAHDPELPEAQVLDDRMHRFHLWVNFNPRQHWAKSVKPVPWGRSPRGRSYERPLRRGLYGVFSFWARDENHDFLDSVSENDVDWRTLPLEKW
ncbi:hypothetical protein ACHAPT_006994 [Fusarium lateritium]